MTIQPELRNRNSSEWLNLAIFSILLLLYSPIFIHWVDGWVHKTISTEHEYFSHGIIGIPYAAYLCWINRKKWQRLPDQTHLFGVILLIVGGSFYLSGIPEWVNLSLPTILTGLCLWFKGLPGWQLQKFPLLLVFLATPTAIPYLISPYSLPLQSFIAGMVGFILNQFGMNVMVYGINLAINGRIVEVAPYCAGLKMLFTTLYMCLMLLDWTNVLSSRRITISFLSIATAASIFGNIIRNTLLTYFHGSGQKGAFNWLHAGWGGDIYSASMLFLLIPLLNWLNQNFLIEEES